MGLRCLSRREPIDLLHVAMESSFLVLSNAPNAFQHKGINAKPTAEGGQLRSEECQLCQCHQKKCVLDFTLHPLNSRERSKTTSSPRSGSGRRSVFE